MDAEDVVTGLDHRIHRFDLYGRVLESFRWAYMHCVILPGAYGANGYVKLPKRTLRQLCRTRDVAGALGFPRRLTYLDRRTGWVGFDTGMPGDTWTLDDAQQYSIDPEQARVLHTLAHRRAELPGAQMSWTIDRVRLHARYLAELADRYGQAHAAPWVRWLFGAPSWPVKPERSE